MNLLSIYLVIVKSANMKGVIVNVAVMKNYSFMTIKLKNNRKMVITKIIYNRSI